MGLGVALVRSRPWGDAMLPSFEGTAFVTVERPTTGKDRHGDTDGYESHEAGPCSVSWHGYGSSLTDTYSEPIDAMEREFALIFRDIPDIIQDDRITLPNGRRYMATNVDIWRSRRNGRVMGVEVRLSGMETGGLREG